MPEKAIDLLFAALREEEISASIDESLEDWANDYIDYWWEKVE